MIILEKFDLVFECGEILVLGDSGRLDVSPMILDISILIPPKTKGSFLCITSRNISLYYIQLNAYEEGVLQHYSICNL